METDFAEVIRQRPHLQRLLWKGKFGLETERLRVEPDGRLAQTPHPATLGSKTDHPYITTDFSESQVEMVTPPVDSVEEAHGFIRTLLSVVREELPSGELLWPQSMPCILPAEEEIPLARFDGDASGRTEYREYLSRIYGRSRQTICGSHFNVSFLPEFLQALARELKQPVEEVKERVYLKVVRNLMRDRWLLVGLLGRSPVFHESLRLKALDSDDLVEICCEFGSSIRCSQIGYQNPEPLFADYCCLEGYLADVRRHVEAGKLLNPNELYLPVRIKTAPGAADISHLEIRVMDLDPFDATGVDLAALRFLHLFVIDALMKPETGEFDRDQQVVADARQNEVACWGMAARECCGERTAPAFAFQEEGLAMLEEMRKRLALDDESRAGYREAWRRFREMTGDWENHPVNVLKRETAAKGYVEFHLSRAREQLEELAKEDFRFHAFPDLELSTQLLLKAAVKRGIHFDLLDRQENFIRLSKGAKKEYVVQATKTSLDTYSHILAMENKKVTKLILHEHGIATPEGWDFTSIDEAKSAWEICRGEPVVVKPVNTNFGIGITILQENDDQNVFERAIETAFAAGRHILIERFVAGKEFRYFVIDDQVVAILHRVPANVTGDGRSTIRELVARKNEDPLRGVGYVTPLEKLRLEDVELRRLQAQGLDGDSVPAEGETIFLRVNSNISTGGDSIDYTNRAHPSYSEIASAAAKALGVKITGLDLIARDIEAPAAPGNHSIIEMNFNPAIHIHCHPYHGENRRLHERILSALGFF